MNSRRQLLQASIGATLLSTISTGKVFAQSSELDQLTILYGFPAGSAGDSVARRLANRLQQLGYARAAVVDNKSGASGRIALDHLKAARPDGRMLCMTPASMLSVYTHVYKNLSYSPLRDFTPIATVTQMHFGLAVGPLVPNSVKTVKDYLEWAKSDPKSNSTYGSAATGTTPHFVGALLSLGSGADLRHVGYRGSVPGINDVIGGQIPAMFAPTGDFIPHYRGGKLRVIATSGRERLQYLPEVSTFVEEGYPELAIEEWHGIFGPPGMPPALSKRASEMVIEATKDKAFEEAAASFGLVVRARNADETAKSLRSEIEMWGPRIKKLGFTLES